MYIHVVHNLMNFNYWPQVRKSSYKDAAILRSTAANHNTCMIRVNIMQEKDGTCNKPYLISPQIIPKTFYRQNIKTHIPHGIKQHRTFNRDKLHSQNSLKHTGKLGNLFTTYHNYFSKQGAPGPYCSPDMQILAMNKLELNCTINILRNGPYFKQT